MSNLKKTKSNSVSGKSRDVKDTISESIIHSILNCECEDVFAFLGSHKIDDSHFAFRVCIPGAHSVDIVDQSGKTISSLMSWQNTHFFHTVIKTAYSPSYMLSVTDDAGTRIVEDPYRFGASISAADLYLFAEGTNDRAYNFLGAHLMTLDGVKGTRFSVWAPNAKTVSVVGDFNYWDGRCHLMRKHIPEGVWEIFIPGVKEGSCYKFELHSRDGTLLPHKSDPVGFFSEQSPGRASIVVDLHSYEWTDQDWHQKKHAYTKNDSAISIYEVQLGSWKRVPEEGNRYLNYRELAEDLIPYVKELGFTHIQLMPISEYPFDGSWGYQPIGMYAPTSRFGPMNDFKYFVDQCHANELAVLIDWVPGHFPTDEHGLGMFDGTPLYEHADKRQGFHPDWNTFIYNFGRREVRSFLVSNALFWLDQFHVDGLRVDAVASMLYLDYSREEGEWLPNAFGGRENLDAIDFLRLANERAYKNYPDCMMVAEESTAWPGVSKPIYAGGLGFGFKWNMGWMNDSLRYIAEDPIHRQHHHHDMTFSLHYAFSENFILPISHDEVVHGKRSMLGKMPGDTWQQFANLRAYYAFMWGHPGKQLLFMGSEFGQGPEWDHDTSLSWHQLDIDEHRGVQSLVRDLNYLYRSRPALFNSDFSPESFEWIEADDSHNSVFAFSRRSLSDGKKVIIVSNLTPVTRESYRIGVDNDACYVELLNTDSTEFGGTNQLNEGLIRSSHIPWHRKPYSIDIRLPGLSTIFLEAE